ncbi:ABC transporter substrate-binding protein [Paenibacillus sp. NPDC058071]|uniref:ABC transporter substrate-binding protein n=1 Tax=Paenibacillus sp. NPDC058071 TaxID=3346326 RepID=UPI0036D9EBB6
MEGLFTIGTWGTVPTKLLDIRHITLQKGKEPLPYRLPANTFLFAVQGEAQLLLDGVLLKETRDQLLHAGKGAVLELRCSTQTYEYVLILYKQLDLVKGVHKHANGSNSYVFQARQPWQLRPLVEQMYRTWTAGKELEKLQAIGLFYRFVSEQFRQQHIAEQEYKKPDLAEEIAAYIDSHYDRAISMDTIAAMFHFSTHYLARVFRHKYGHSPLTFLVQVRMNRAKDLLAYTRTPILDIAEQVGYSDLYYFNKQFKKHLGITPVQYRLQFLDSKGSNRPRSRSNTFIAPQTSVGYSVINETNNQYQLETRGMDEMNLLRKRAVACLIFGLTLLLGACGGAETTNEKAASTGSGGKEETTQTSSPSLETRQYTDALGNQVEIPVNPRKAVVVTYGGYLLPLGLMPVGADSDTLKRYEEEMADVRSIGEGLGNVEEILALQPDLIIVPDYFDPSKYINYKKIAPTIAVAWGGDPDVVNTLRTMGDIMNRKTEAEAWISKFEEKLQRIRDQIDVKIEPGTTATSFIIYEGEFLMGGTGGTLGKLIYQDYGFEMPKNLKKFEDGGTALSVEGFVAEPADYFFTQMTEEELPDMLERFKEPLYQEIPAIKNNRVINVSRENWNYGPYLVDKAVDDLISQMNKLQ